MIDAHQHLWRIGRNDCAWPTVDLAAIHRDYDIADLEAAARPLGVNGSVLVQSQPSDRDTDWLLDVAAGAPFVLGVVGWADLKAVDAPARVAHLARQPKLKGLRPMLQGLEPDWILDPAVEPAVRAMVEHELTFDALVFPRHLRGLTAFAERHPDLAIIIDHGAKPLIGDDVLDPWRDDIAALAAMPQVTCKVSGLLTEARGRSSAALAPYVEHLLAVFGPQRLMWGSDWPVVELVNTYAGWFRLARDLVGEAAASAVFGDVARRVYKL
jgi:L-fuconolactonase